MPTPTEQTTAFLLERFQSAAQAEAIDRSEFSIVVRSGLLTGPRKSRGAFPAFRFSLRTLVILFTASCLACGWVGRCLSLGYQKAKAVERLRACYCDVDDEPESVLSRWVYGWMPPAYRGSVRRVNLSEESLTPKCIAALASLPSCGSVEFFKTIDSPESLAQLKLLAGSPHPVSLQLHFSYDYDPPPELLAACLPLSTLRELALNERSTGDAHLAALAGAKSLERLELRGSGSTAAGVASLASLPQLKALDVWGNAETLRAATQIPALEELSISCWGDVAVDFSPLRQAIKLRSLRVSGGGVKDDSCEGISRLPALESLEIFEASIGDAGFAQLSSAGRLRELRISSTPISEAGLASISRIPNLKVLSIGSSSAEISDGGAKQISNCLSLEELNLYTTDLSDVGLEQLSRLPRLHKLVLFGKITDAGLQPLVTQRSLRELTLWGSGISDAGADMLAGATHLTKLDVTNSKISNPKLRWLQKQLPNCKVQAIRICCGNCMPPAAPSAQGAQATP